jgi:2-aminoethylphosphonate dioxygenase
MTAPGPLDANSVAHFQRRGWVLAPGFFAGQDAVALARWTDQITALPERPGRQMVYREAASGDANAGDVNKSLLQRIENFCPHHAAMDALARQGPLPQAVAQLLGSAAVLFKDKINFKLPGGGGFDLHQDQQAGWSAYAPFFLTALVSIDRATIANGCLEIADMPRANTLLGPEWRPLTVAELGGHALMPVPTGPGDVIFFDSFVAHASRPNPSASRRRVLYLTYNKLAEGDHRARYFQDKRENFPPDIERVPGREYTYRV